jgi:hypothetical protein
MTKANSRSAEPATYRVPEAARVAGVGNAAIRKGVHNGTVPQHSFRPQHPDPKSCISPMAGLMWTHWRCRDLSYLNAARPRPSIRQDEKQGRESGHGGVVRVFAEDGYIVARLDRSSDSEQIRRLLAAPNAVPVRKHAGELVGIRLLSLGDDRGHAGERHGRSTITTERVRNDHGVYIGGNRTLKHKLENC